MGLATAPPPFPQVKPFEMRLRGIILYCGFGIVKLRMKDDGG